MTVHEKFVEDLDGAGIHTEGYLGRFFWEGPAARSDEQNGPTLLDIIKVTAVSLQWDRQDFNYIVYPVGKAKAGWNEWPTQKTKKLNRTATTTPTLIRLPKTMTKKTE
jgi:hypothetical protein